MFHHSTQSQIDALGVRYGIRYHPELMAQLVAKYHPHLDSMLILQRPTITPCYPGVRS